MTSIARFTPVPIALALAAAALFAAPIAAAEPRDAFLEELTLNNVALPGVNTADTVAAGLPRLRSTASGHQRPG
jgi:hypothetical protein